MADIRGTQAGFNAASGDQWDRFASHRAAVSKLLGGGSGRLCVLGAGNANDLDLPLLLDHYREVHLVDLDPAALDRGAAGQGVTDHPGLHRHGGLDVTAMLDTLEGWTAASQVDDPALVALAEWPARRLALALPGPFDRVASTCLLSQLVGLASTTLGERHPRFPRVVEALRLGHLRLLAGLARPGGAVTLITDVVSTRHLPGLDEVPESELPSLLRRLSRGTGLIHGVNPRELLDLVGRDPALRSRVAGIEPAPPWRWRLHDRTYLVWAMTWRMDGRGIILGDHPRPT